MSSLRDDLRRLADGFEATAAPEATVTGRIDGRLRSRRAMVPALAALAAVVAIALGVVVQGLLTSPNAAVPVMPDTVGLFRTTERDQAGTCFAVRLYDTTAEDGRVALWAWTGVDGCAARKSNLFAGRGTAGALALPAGVRHASRAGIRVTVSTADGLLEGLDLVLDPLASDGRDVVPGFRSIDELGGAHTVQLTRIDSLDVPYRPE